MLQYFQLVWGRPHGENRICDTVLAVPKDAWPHPTLQAKNLKTYFWNMFGGFEGLEGTRKNHTNRSVWSLNYLAKRKTRKTTKIIFRVFNTSNSSPILSFCPRNPKSYFCWKYKKTRARKWSRSVLSKVNLEPYDPILCQFGSQFPSPKTKNMNYSFVFSYRRDSISVSF